MKCPACRVQLQTEHHLDIHIDYCPNCQGFWLDVVKLNALAKRSLLSTWMVRQIPHILRKRFRHETGAFDQPREVVFHDLLYWGNAQCSIN